VAQAVKVKVQYLGLVKTYTNKGTDEFDLKEGAPLSELLNKIASTSSKQFTQDIYEPNQKDVKSLFTVMVNGIVMGQLNGIETRLKDGDNVIIMPLMTGG
jgi:sulfur-carrier protein